MHIEEKLIKFNFSSREGQTIQYIVIHDTGNENIGSNADAHYRLFNSEDRGASAHYFVDDKEILRVVRDEDKSWHCGDGKGKYGIRNENSIGIEMCINKDGDFKKTYINTIDLTKYLMEKYNIPIENVVRHYDASRKICPNIFSKNNWEQWGKFKETLEFNTTEYIKDIYRKLLKREVDEDGLKFWENELKGGMSKGDFLVRITESEEFISLTK